MFAVVQLGLGVGLLVLDGRGVRVVLVASVVWALGVCYVGEGLGGLAEGQATLQVGAPGAALLYAILAIGVWPGRERAVWTRVTWATLWCGGGLLGVVIGHGYAAGLVALELAVGFGALWRATAVPAVVTGIATAAGFWVVGQDFGQLTSGIATDPNSGPLLALMGLTVIRSWVRDPSDHYGAYPGYPRGTGSRSSAGRPATWPEHGTIANTRAESVMAAVAAAPMACTVPVRNARR
jgi:hypothetical protein